jgi:hypothetical protein
MTTTFIYPSSYELMMIERDKIPRLTQNRPIFEILPLKNVESSLLVWEQLDNITGLQQVRGMGGAPQSVNALGGKQMYGQPGVYGEVGTIDEKQLTDRRQWGDYHMPVDISDLVMEKQDQLLERRLNRIEKNGWDLLATGTFTAIGKVGQVLHTDTFTTQTYPVGIGWANLGTATPLADFRGVQLLARGHSVNFGRQAKAYMNQNVFNHFVSNTNTSDLGSKRTYGLASITGLDDVNRILTGDNLPTIVIYDEVYIDDNGANQLYLPDKKVIVVGQRQTGVPIGAYQFTRNANNPDMAPGPYMRIIDNLERSLPRKIEVHDGHNGGPVLFFPASVVEMTVDY